MSSLIKLSLLIITRKWDADIFNYDYIKTLKQRDIDFEVLIAEGRNPSGQRNFLAQQAEGDFILFLDDDSVPEKDLLEKYCETLRLYPKAEIIGGPSLLNESKELISQLSTLFFSSSLGIGPIRSRYNALGKTRKATEKELILCNLFMRKDFFLQTRGFDQSIYPGEENAFLKSLHANTHIIYNPHAIVYRNPRNTWVSFSKQMISYGKGRAKHLKLKHSFEYWFLIPMFFSLYIVCIPLFLIHKLSIFLLPLSFYILLLLFPLFGASGQLKMRRRVCLPLFFFLGHFCYGIGLLGGLIKYKILRRFSHPTNLEDQIKVRKLKTFKISTI